MPLVRKIGLASLLAGSCVGSALVLSGCGSSDAPQAEQSKAITQQKTEDMMKAMMGNMQKKGAAPAEKGAETPAPAEPAK